MLYFKKSKFITFAVNAFILLASSNASLQAAAVAACVYTPNPGDNAFRQCINMQTYCKSCDPTIATRCTGCYSSNGCSYDHDPNLNTCVPHWDTSTLPPGPVTNPPQCPRFSGQYDKPYDRCKHLVPKVSVGIIDFLVANDALNIDVPSDSKEVNVKEMEQLQNFAQ